MPKTKRADPPIEIKLSLPSSIVAKVDLLLFDPVRNRIRYGGRSKLVSQLLHEWIERGETGEELITTPAPTDHKESEDERDAG